MSLELTAVDYLGPMEWGVTSPQLFRANDGHLYVVKLCGNKVGLKALANEWLAMTLGGRLGLCFPQSGAIWLDSRLLQQNRRLRKAAVQTGPHFACRYLSRSTYVDRAELSRAVNKEELAGVMLFDHMLHNVDRTHNRKNLLIRREEGGSRIYAIDHSHLFRRGRWTAQMLAELAGDLTVNTRRVYGLLLKYYLQPDDFNCYAQAIRGLTDEVLCQAVESIPEVWLPDRTERQVLAQHLIVRRNLIDEIKTRLVSLIPAGRRRNNPLPEVTTASTSEEEQILPAAIAQLEESTATPERPAYRCHPYRRAYHGPQPNRRIAIKERELRARFGDLYSSLWFF